MIIKLFYLTHLTQIGKKLDLSNTLLYDSKWKRFRKLSIQVFKIKIVRQKDINLIAWSIPVRLILGKWKKVF